jgi:hypothetical protein
LQTGAQLIAQNIVTIAQSVFYVDESLQLCIIQMRNNCATTSKNKRDEKVN